MNLLHCLSCDHQLDDGMLCQRCESRTAERLGQMPLLYDSLAAYLRPAVRGPGTVSGPEAPYPPLPVDEAVLDLRGPGGMVGVLEDWRAALWRDLEWSGPVLAGSLRERLDAAVAGLRANVRWIGSSWPEAGEFATEVRQLHAAAMSIVGPAEPTVRAGYCTTELEDGSVCGAALRTRLQDPEIVCPWCRTAYPPSAWLALAQGAA